MAWTTATLSEQTKESRGVAQHPDVELPNEFRDEFEAVPRMEQAETKTKLNCTRDNMNYIKSSLPMHHVGLQDFYTEMARKQWNAAKPMAGKGGMAPAFMKMGMAIGARRDMTGNQVADMSRPRMPGGVATDWKSIPELERVNAYVFRGDKRHPRMIKLANGFHPPSTRKDNAYVGVIASYFVKYMKDRYNQDVNKADIEQYVRGKGQPGRVFTEYEMWREILRGEEMHIGRMTVDEFLKGYISTSRSVQVATSFAQSASRDGRRDPIIGVYAMHSEGGFMLPDAGKHSHAHRAECEVAHPGPITWDKVIGFRFQVSTSVDDPRTWQKQSKIVLLRKDFRMRDPKGAYEVLKHLSSVL